MKACNVTKPEKDFNFNELGDTFFSVKLNKIPGYDEINFNVIKKCFGSLENGTFWDGLKTARATPLFKNGSNSDL